MKALRPLLALLLLPLLQDEGAEERFEEGFAAVDEEELVGHLVMLASPELEGRDSPSQGLARAADYLEQELEAHGYEPAFEGGTFRQTFMRTGEAPTGACALEYRAPDRDAESLELGVDFVPLPDCAGEARGPLVFAGFGITDSRERYDDLRSADVDGRIVMFLEGEPRHKKLFDGPEITRDSDVYRKLHHLTEAGAKGALVVRRSPEEPSRGPDGVELPPTPLGFRHTWAPWNGIGDPREDGGRSLPVVEITEEVATTLLGQDVREVAQRIDKRGRPEGLEREELEVYLRVEFAEQDTPLDNVAGLLKGRDPELAGEYVVLGAHYDHIGVDAWGRVGCGADDNASGTAALLEVAQALAAARPARSVIVAFFAAEEDGLIGSRRFVENSPVSLPSIAGMLNMDMLGVGSENELVAIGVHANPGFEDLVSRAKKLESTKIKTIETKKGLSLWERSDHFSFHEVGIPTLFFTEGYPETDNKDYHTFRDTLDTLNVEKIVRSARFIYNAAWLLATEPERLPAPE